MVHRVTATDAKNNFGGLLEHVAAQGRVDVMKHGRLVAVVLAPRYAEALRNTPTDAPSEAWGITHMIAPRLARAAQMVRRPEGFDDP